MHRLTPGWRIFIERSEQILFILLYLHLLITFWPALKGDASHFLLLYALDQTILIVFLITRRAAIDMSGRPLDHVIALCSTLLPLLAVPTSGKPLLPMPAIFAMATCGMLFHLSAKFSLRRSFGVLPANRGIKTGGAYRYVRHPIYLGYIIFQLSLVLAGPVAWNVAIFVVGLVLFVLRIRMEERLLNQSEEYRQFCQKTPYRLILGLY